MVFQYSNQPISQKHSENWEENTSQFPEPLEKKKKVHKFIAPDIEVGEAYLVHMLYGEHSRLRKISTIQIIFEDDLPKI